MTEFSSLLFIDGVNSSALLVLLIKGSVLCLLGVTIGLESSPLPAVVRHRIAAGTVYGLGALPLLAALVNPWELPILPTKAVSGAASSAPVFYALAGTYVGVTAFLMARLCIDLLCIARLSGRAQSAGMANELLAGLDHPWGDTPIRYSSEIRSPLTWGWLRPQILLPHTAHEWQTDDLFMALQHELAHVQRRDWAGHLMARCVHAIYWPIPGIRLLLRQLSLSAEQACDDRVLATGVAAPHYAAMLLRQAQGNRVAASVSLGHSTELGTRIRYLVVEVVDHSAFAAGSVATFVSCFLLTLTLATAQLSPRPDIPVVPWGSVAPDTLEAAVHPRPTLRVSDALLASLEAGPTRPLPPPAPLKPPRFEALEKPTVPPPGTSVSTP